MHDEVLEQEAKEHLLACGVDPEDVEELLVTMRKAGSFEVPDA